LLLLVAHRVAQIKVQVVVQVDFVLPLPQLVAVVL
jgi:hypothetical protein